MAAFGAGDTPAQIIASARGKLQAVRFSLADCQNFNAWLAGLNVTDVATEVALSSTDAGTFKAAFADAGALWQLYGRGDPATDGTLPAGYTLPYTFGASQRAVLGPA